MNSTYRERIEQMKQEFFASDKSEKSWDLTVGLRLDALIQEVAKSAKPNNCDKVTMIEASKSDFYAMNGFNKGIDQYEQNIKELLGGSDE